jgi:Pyruvate/2-oxoacid:ferredoxin oxidoreductase gamma subunit
MERAIKESVPEKTLKENLNAYRKGIAAVAIDKSEKT